MYTIYSVNDTVRVPPAELGGDLKKTILKIAQGDYEGMLDDDMGVVVSVIGIENVGEGRVVPGDAGVYYSAEIKMLLYKPRMHEVVEGTVSEVTEFGAFVRTGPVEGLVHVSQIMDDYINYDPKLPGFVGKETSKKLQLNDNVLARVVTISLKGSIASSKIGLTMRQLGLGKEEWQKIDEKTKVTRAERDVRQQAKAVKEKAQRKGAADSRKQSARKEAPA
ncbi:MAG: DNA-directed RNA polymerase [Candidatus Diapherotrites archaeon]